jgi:(p)ppGpp synthase/HD superfamily hydrolase
MKMNRAIDLLNMAGARKTRHSGRTLFEHLTNTHDLLAYIGAEPHVCRAGLVHSIYGTTVFKTASIKIDHRPVVADVVGEDAERVAWLFCVSPRPHEVRRDGKTYYLTTTDGEVEVSKKDLNDLALVAAVNKIEQMIARKKSFALQDKPAPVPADPVLKN